MSSLSWCGYLEKIFTAPPQKLVSDTAERDQIGHGFLLCGFCQIKAWFVSGLCLLNCRNIVKCCPCCFLFCPGQPYPFTSQSSFGNLSLHSNFDSGLNKCKHLPKLGGLYVIFHFSDCLYVTIYLCHKVFYSVSVGNALSPLIGCLFSLAQRPFNLPLLVVPTGKPTQIHRNQTNSSYRIEKNK